MPDTVTTEDLDFLGCRARILLDADAADARVGVVDMLEVPAGHMPPLHVHHAEDEGFLVLAGSVTLYVPDGAVSLGPGDFFRAPRGVPHTYRVGDAPARF